MTTTPTSGAADLPEALHRVIDDFERRERGIPQAHIAAALVTELVTELRASLAAGQATAAQPVLWVSPEQFANFMDADEAPFGKYVPARKTSAGNFTMPLFAAPAQPAAQQGAAYAALPNFDDGEEPIWHAIFSWANAERGSDAAKKAMKIESAIVAQLRAFADATHALRASHGQAPAGAAEEIDKALNVYAQAFAARVNGWTRQNGDDLPGARSALFAAIHAYAQASTRPTTSPQADSVQEDAADPLQGAANWLAEAHGQFSPVVLSGCLMIGYNRAKRLHDAALAARKQGEKQ